MPRLPLVAYLPGILLAGTFFIPGLCHALFRTKTSFDRLKEQLPDKCSSKDIGFAGDILEEGIVLAGGGALLKNLDKRVAERTGLPVNLAEDALAVVVRGTGAVLDDLEYYRAVLV